ncbi:hypothetical protein FCL40_05365 [Ferrimonas sediminicola]|uniref:Uncharacterized protein n=1 Tax=Ferrimonas sediminicola TaxID=2569538 RepID=A0A4U1BKF8_9GAMM|nr:hypothetical protein [Ferrimonas sediminicola]TKB50580.1 hypothetical protein FCL40_05365 [Ferrimonas sediminicola]
MMNSKFTSLSLLVGSLLLAPALYADNTASAFTEDGTAVIGAAAVRASLTDEEGFTKVLSTELKNSGTPKDLVIGLSFETSLFTETVVASKNGNKTTSMADATIEMKVYVDGVPAAPGTVIFDKRTQTLWAKLGGSLDCTDTNGDSIVSFDECLVTEEEIGLILDTRAAHTFNFLAYNIGSGSHTIEAYAKLSKDGEVVVENPEDGYGSTNASASLGKGTLSVWEVHGSNTN